MNNLTTAQHRDLQINNKIYFNVNSGDNVFIKGTTDAIILNPGFRLGDTGLINILSDEDRIIFRSTNAALDNDFRYNFRHNQLETIRYGSSLTSPHIDLQKEGVVKINNVIELDGINISRVNRDDAKVIAMDYNKISSITISPQNTSNLLLESYSHAFNYSSEYCETGLMTKNINLSSLLVDNSTQLNIGASMINIEQNILGITNVYDPHVYCTITSNRGQLAHIPQSGAKPDKFMIKPNCLELNLDDDNPMCRSTWPLVPTDTMICHAIDISTLESNKPVFNSGLTLSNYPMYNTNSVQINVDEYIINQNDTLLSPDIIAVTNTPPIDSNPLYSFVGILVNKNIVLNDTKDYNMLTLDFKTHITLTTKPTFIGSPVSVATRGVCIVSNDVFVDPSSVKINDPILINSQGRFTVSSTSTDRYIGNVLSINNKFITCHLK